MSRKAAIAAERKRVNALNALRRKYDPDNTLVTDDDFARFAEDEAGGETALLRDHHRHEGRQPGPNARRSTSSIPPP